MIQRVLTFWMALLFLSSYGVEARVIAGKVIAAEGEIIATWQNDVRKLIRGSTFFVDDTIDVKPEAKIQLRYTDGSLVDLIPQTTYKVVAYSFNDTKGATDKFTTELVEGGLRQLTGNVAKKNPESVEVRTPVATIGIRGTNFVIYYQKPELFVGCTYGVVSVSNQKGSVLIGPSEHAQFAAVNFQPSSGTTQGQGGLSTGVPAPPSSASALGIQGSGSGTSSYGSSNMPPLPAATPEGQPSSPGAQGSESIAAPGGQPSSSLAESPQSGGGGSSSVSSSEALPAIAAPGGQPSSSLAQSPQSGEGASPSGSSTEALPAVAPEQATPNISDLSVETPPIQEEGVAFAPAPLSPPVTLDSPPPVFSTPSFDPPAGAFPIQPNTPVPAGTYIQGGC